MYKYDNNNSNNNGNFSFDCIITIVISMSMCYLRQLLRGPGDFSYEGNSPKPSTAWLKPKLAFFIFLVQSCLGLHSTIEPAVKVQALEFRVQGFAAIAQFLFWTMDPTGR